MVYRVDAGEDDLFVLSDLKNMGTGQQYMPRLGMVKPDRMWLSVPQLILENIQGTINRPSNVFDPEERVMKAIIEISNNLELKPSMMSKKCERVQKSTRRVVGIPSSAVIFDNNTYRSGLS